MRKRIRFAVAIAIVGLALGFWINKAGVIKTNADVARPRLDLSSPILNPYLRVQVLEPVY
jgi:hypothetical protein